METARSIVFDRDMNTYNEDAFFTRPGWAGVSGRNLEKPKGTLIGFMNSPEYTDRGYRFTFFPVGNTMIWIPPILAARFLYCAIPSLTLIHPDTGYSFPYLMAMGIWNIMIWLAGMRIAYALCRRFFSPAVSVLAITSVMGAGNLLPFVFIDICFSHAIDFFLLTSAIELWLQTRESRQPATFFLWGTVSGLAMIVRYQDVAFLILPFFQIIYDRSWGNRPGRSSKISSAAGYILFLIGLLAVSGSQVLYWRILHGQWLVSGKTMGTAAIPTFNPLNPELIPMLFSDYHGLFAWMPLLALALIGFFWFVWKNPAIGVPLLSLFLIETYYNASRSEWWNLGFGVRRFSGMSVIFVLGAGMLISPFRNRWRRLAAIAVIVLGCIWNVLFMVQFYQHQFHGDSSTAYDQLVDDDGPYGEVRYRWVGPRIRPIPAMIRGFREWILGESLPVSAVSALISSHGSRNAAGTINFILAFCVAWSVVALVGCSVIRREVKCRFMSCTAAIAVLAIYAGLWLLDHDTRLYRFVKMNRNAITGEISEIRLAQGSIFWGENEQVERAGDTIRSDLNPALKSDNVYLLLLRPPSGIDAVNYNQLLKLSARTDSDGVLSVELPRDWRRNCRPVEGKMDYSDWDDRFCVQRIAVETSDPISAITLNLGESSDSPKIFSIWMDPVNYSNP